MITQAIIESRFSKREEFLRIGMIDQKTKTEQQQYFFHKSFLKKIKVRNVIPF